MRKTKKLLSLLTAAAMTISAFSGFAITASATETVTSYDFEDGNAVFANDSRITAAVEDNTDLNSKVVGFTCASNAQNGYSFSHYDFSSAVEGATQTIIEFDYYNTNGGRAIMTLGDASVRGNSGGSSKTTYSNIGAAFNLGSDKSNSILNDEKSDLTDYTGKWMHVKLDVNEIANTYSYVITGAKEESVQAENVAFIAADAQAVTQIDLFGYINSSHCAMIDNLSITSVIDENVTYQKVTVKKVCDDEEISSEEVEVATGATYTPVYDTTFDKDGYKYTYVSGGDAVKITVDTTITLVYSKRALVETSYTVTAVLGDDTKTVKEGTVVEDSSVTVGYPKYIINNDGKLYNVAAEALASKMFHCVAITGTQENQEIKVTYTALTDTPVYYAEMEDVLTDNEVSNALIRCSNGAGGDVEESQAITHLSAGTYKVTTAVWGGGKTDESQSTYTISAGETVAATATTTGSLVTVEGTEFTLTEEADLVVTKTVTGTSSACVDYVLVTGTGTATDIATPEPEPTATPEPEPTATPEPEPTATPIPFEPIDTTDTFDGDSLPTDWFVSQAGTNTYAVADGVLTMNVSGNDNKLYIGKHVTTVAEAAGKLITVTFEYKSNSGTATGNAGSEIGFLAYDDDNVTWVQAYTDKLGVSDVVNTYGLTDTDTTYVVQLVFDNNAKTATIAAAPKAAEGDTVLPEATAITLPSQTLDINTVYFRTGRGKTDVVDNFNVKVVESTSEPVATPIPTATPEPSDEPEPTPTVDPSAPTPSPTPEPTPAPAGAVLYSQDYQSATEADWTTATTDRYTPLLVTEESGNVYLSVDQTQRYNNGTTLTSPTYGIEGSKIAVEFDAKLGSSNDQASTKLSVNTTDGTLFTIIQSGKNTTSWIINDSTTVTLPGSATNSNSDQASLDAIPWYHFTVAYNEGATYVTVTDASGTEILPQTLVSSGTLVGGVKNMTFATSRYYADFAIDNLVIRTLKENETPDIKYYNATINTTRYANLTTSTGEKYYADVNGYILIPLLTSGTTFDYTLTKVGYNDVTGSVAIANEDVVQEKPMELTDPNTIFIESDFGNESGAYISADGSRADSISLGSVSISELCNISVDFTLGSLSAGNFKTWFLEADAGKLVGIQFEDGGMYAFTGWTSDTANQYDDLEAYTEGKRIGDVPSGDFTINFVVDPVNKTITVSYGEVSESLTYDIEATAITGMSTGLYRTTGALSVTEIELSKPDASYMSVNGASKVAKVSGALVTKEYTRSESVIDPTETFTWTLANAPEGVTINNNGVLSIADTATPGTVTITATGTSGKTASKDVEIADFQQMATFTADGPQAYDGVGATGAYKITAAVDPIGDDILALIPAANVTWTSSDENVVKVDAATGAAESTGFGSAVITATFTNGTAVSTSEIPVAVKTYSIIVDATGDSTKVDMADIVSDSSIIGYQVTTAKDGEIVKQYDITSADIQGAGTKLLLMDDATMYQAQYTSDGTLISVTATPVAKGYEEEEWAIEEGKRFYWNEMTPVGFEEVVSGGYIVVDTTGATTVEVAPIYSGALNTVYAVPVAQYDVTATVNNGRRTDLYVNDQMLFNNLNQGSDNWTVGRTIAESADYTVKNIVFTEGYANFNLRDDQSSGSTVTKVKFVKSPSIVNRPTTVYVIGDSLVAKYYGDAPAGQESLVRTGWGDVIANYIADDVEVSNLGNSGAWATGMLGDAFTQVINSAQAGDVVIWESGYNDRSYSTTDKMKEAMKTAADKCKEMGVSIYFVTPNASAHDYTDSVVYSSSVIEAGEEAGVPVIDLSAKSYAFLSEKYGKDVSDGTEAKTILLTYYNNTGDTLHSSYNAANCWASIVAQGLYDAGQTSIINTDYSYTFNDGTNDITVKVTPAN